MNPELKIEQEFNCTCTTCVKACSVKPGWFLPGEAERAASMKGMKLPEFFKQYLMVDWLENANDDDRDVFVLSPAIQSTRVNKSNPGAEFGGDPRGKCVFFIDERCSIYGARPFECKALDHAEDGVLERHREVGRTWTDHQDQIVELLGREPESESFSGGGLFGGFFDRWMENDD